MVINPFKGEPLEYKISAFMSDMLEENPKHLLKSTLSGIILAAIGSMNPYMLEASFYTQPLTLQQGYKIIAKTVREITEEYALKVAETGSLYSE